MFSWIALLDVIELLFLVHINQHATRHRAGEAGVIDFKRLKNDVAVGQDDRRTPLLDVFDYFLRIRKKPLGESISDQKMRNGEQVRRARMLNSVSSLPSG